MIHEFDHGFDNYYHNMSNDPDHFAGNYFYGTEMPRNFDGYKCPTSTCLEHSWADFPVDKDFGDPKANFLEEFGDMYLNWVLDGNPDYPQNGFTTDVAGNQRRKDMNDRMQDTWLPNIGVLK